MQVQTLRNDAAARLTWRAIKIQDRQGLRRALMAKHGSLTSAAANMEIAYVRLSAAISGRENIVNVVSAIQRDLELEDSQVLTIWPLLRVWPRELAC